MSSKRGSLQKDRDEDDKVIGVALDSRGRVSEFTCLACTIILEL